MLLGVRGLDLCLIELWMLDLLVLIKTAFRSVYKPKSLTLFKFARIAHAKKLLNLPVALGAVLNWTDIVSLDLVGCSSMALSPLVRDVKGHAERLFMCLSIRLYSE